MSRKAIGEAIMQRAIARWEGEGGALLQDESTIESPRLDQTEPRLSYRLGEAAAGEWLGLPSQAQRA